MYTFWTKQARGGQIAGAIGLAIIIVLIIAGERASAGITDLGNSRVVASGVATPCGTWSAVNSPNPNPNSTYLFGMEAIAANDIWTVGHNVVTVFPNPETEDSLTMHWDGSQWEIVPSPNPTSLHNRIYDAAAISTDNIWAVGSWFNQGSTEMLGMHWNGTAWTTVTMPGSGQLNAVSAVSENDAWAVGSYLDGSVFRMRAVHWNGSAWQLSTLPDIGPQASFLFSVMAVSANDVWAVGRKGNHPNYASLILHWDGINWSEVAHPDVKVLWSVDAISPTDMWAVGGGSLHWDGTMWSEELISVPADTTLAGVAMVSANDVWATGYFANGTGTETLMRHWDGSAWSEVTSFNTNNFNVLTAIDAASATEVWAVGHSSEGGGAPYNSMTGRFLPDIGCPTPTWTSTPTQTSVVTATSTPTASSTAPATATPTTACTVEFSDVAPGSTFYSYVRCLACKGIVSGYPDGTFRPNNSVSRGQIAKMVSESAGFVDPPGSQKFEDVPTGSTFYDWANRLANRNVMMGYPCGSEGEPCVAPGNLPYFRPSAPATRGQISKIVSEAAGFAEPVSGQGFQDVPTSHTFYEWIGRLASRSIVAGYDCGQVVAEPCIGPGNLPYFRPQAAVTRGQAAKIVSIAFFPECEVRQR